MTKQGESDEHAQWIAAPAGLHYTRLRGKRLDEPFPAPQEAASHEYTPEERDLVSQQAATRIVGGPELRGGPGACLRQQSLQRSRDLPAPRRVWRRAGRLAAHTGRALAREALQQRAHALGTAVHVLADTGRRPALPGQQQDLDMVAFQRREGGIAAQPLEGVAIGVGQGHT